MIRAWQIGMTLLFAYAILNFATAVTQIESITGTFGFTTLRDQNGAAIIQSVTPGGPAARARIHAGDSLTFDATPDFLTKIVDTIPGDRIVVTDAGHRIELVAVFDASAELIPLFIFFTVAKFAFLAMGALVAWRRADDAGARALALFLMCFGAGIDSNTAMIPSVTGRLALFVLTQCLFMTGGAAFYAFTTLFPRPATSGIRLWMRRSVPYVAILGTIVAVSSIFGTFFLHSSVTAPRLLTATYVTFYLAMIAGAVWSLIVSFRASTGDERARMRWTMITFAVGFSGIAALFIALLFGARNDNTQFLASTIIAIPLGLSYVILRHRMLDIGFVVNRAVVYTGVSVIVVGAFVLFEWLLSHVVEQNSRASVVLQLGGALALGFSVRYVHARVDRYVDDFFFRDRHAAEQAIRRFAHEAALITDPDTLIRRTVEVAQRNARLSGVAFYAQRERRFLPLHSSFAVSPELDENDSAVLDMRAFREVVRLHETESLVPGETAFPMVVRGQLAGFLACGEKTNHEALAPDESDALRVLARDAGIALDSLRIARIEAELAFLSTDSALPASLRVRLSSLSSRADGTQPAGAAARSSQ